jgi:asparagine synthetase B (glutamine-hydrolysing)
MGIIRHYYYSDNESFFASNNSFLVALLAEANIAPEAIYETLFFRFPYKWSYFQNVKAINPYEYIEYNIQRKEFKIQPFSQPDNLSDYYQGSIEEGISDFWVKIKPLQKSVKVSFSGGSSYL